MRSAAIIFSLIFFTVHLAFSQSNYHDVLKLHIDFVQRDSFKILTLSIENISDSAIQIIKPGDGSDEPWREPYIFFTGEVKTDQGWKELKRREYVRCGNYDPDWFRDTLTINPRTTIKKIYWSGMEAKDIFMVNRGDIIRMAGHYDFGNGRHARSDKYRNSNINIQPFQLTSEEINVKIE